ncbi:PREDICTED: protein MEI2-like 2 [Tarenaya hassleriana]|uniref:protein MEI2-like 2 n=1 Tax=Tarenaya hassleriana TaxID=28532 RepID=UPI00053C36F7|nr:PREDICTED: protein MEI2-like 2 [Tarenaya hassleriana]XP_010554977.1 PREDICTED: protein MEI2-like 2 [Tarenaya hassleriana]XP_010555032.1 PREDICTED: protein MEI2-like 2 [Tarenaya hassleriana]XP_010555084.1 PREDICTED: protein MEI2-like 2 [Tarenaya hassleriana]XP_010555146.1 PREDICTED: protein MEI2-like 2 [Tarenaya hassleriana]
MSKSPLASGPSGSPHGRDAYPTSSHVTLFSSSLPTLSHEKLVYTDSDSWLSLDDSSPNLNKLATGNSEKDSSEDVEPNSLEILLPEDENELLPGLIDELNFNGLPDELEDLEDCDVFCMGGGLELDVEPRDNHVVDVSEIQMSGRGVADSLIPRKFPNMSGRSSVEHPHGEHPSRTLFVRNINSNIEDSELRALFEPFGEIRSLYTACKSRGFVMISYYDIRAAHTALRALQGTLLRKRTLDIHFSIPKENPSEKDMNQGTLVVFNVDTSVSNDELCQIFSVYGEVKEIRETPHRRFHRFIEYFDVRHAEATLKALNRSEIGGKRIKLELSRPGGARRLSVPIAGQDMERHEAQSFFNQVGSQIAGSPPGNWANTGPPISAKSSHAFPRSHGLEIVRPANPGNPHGLASILPSHSTVSPIFSPTGNDQGVMTLNKGLFRNTFYAEPRSFPEHSAGAVSNSMRFLDSRFSVSSGTSSDHGYLWGSPPQAFNYSGHAGSMSSSGRPFTARHGFPYSGRQGSLLGKYQHHVGSAPSSIHLGAQISYSWESQGINGQFLTEIRAHPQEKSGVGLPWSQTEPDFPGFGMLPTPQARYSGNPGSGSTRTERYVEHDRVQQLENHTQTQIMDDRWCHVDLDRITTGDDIRTTLMIENIPNKYTFKMLTAEIDEKHKGDYDFLYLPADFKNKCNLGYALINMVSPLHIVPFHQTFNGKRWEKFNTGKIATLAYAKIQGKAALVSYTQSSSPVNEEKQWLPNEFQSEGQ